MLYNLYDFLCSLSCWWMEQLCEQANEEMNVCFELNAGVVSNEIWI